MCQKAVIIFVSLKQNSIIHLNIDSFRCTLQEEEYKIQFTNV